MIAPSSDRELLALRRRCANALSALVPLGVGTLYFGGRWPVSARLARSGPAHYQQHQQQQGVAGYSQHDTQSEAKAEPGSSDYGVSQGGLAGDGGAPSPVPGASAAGTAKLEGAGGGEQDERILAEIESGILDVFSDAYCNKHLMYSVVELILVRLIPELTEKGIVELWEERLS